MKGITFSLTSARLPTCPAERVIWNLVKCKEKKKIWEGVKQRDKDYWNFYRCAVHSDICRVHSPTKALLLI